ncbi:MAG: LPS export ABC transporter periplasmic protein LptC [Pseudomonadota bacterium]
MDASRHPIAAPVDRDAVFARWERRLTLVNALRRALPALMGVIALTLVGMVAAASLKAPRPVKVEDTVIRMVGARFQGRVKDGRTFLIGAREAARDERVPQRVTLTEPIMVVGAETATPRRLMARTGVYDERTRLLQLVGEVRIDDGLGNRVASNDVTIDTRTGSAVGEKGIVSDGPQGQVSADSYAVKDKGDRIEFRGRVRTRVNTE